jgi:hypothetical protein
MLEVSKRTQEGLKENVPEVWDKEVLPSSSPECNHFDYFVLGVSELMVKAKPHNKTKDLILKIKEVMGSLDRDTVAKAFKKYASRIEAVVTADGDLIEKLMLIMLFCKFFFISIKSDDFQLCYAIFYLRF